MSENPMQVHIPAWTLGDRLRKSLRDAGVSVQEMAEHLDVSRNTIGNWLSDRTGRPSRSALMVWAMRCGVPFEWLLTGEAELSGPENTPTTRRYDDDKGHATGVIAA